MKEIKRLFPAFLLMALLPALVFGADQEESEYFELSGAYHPPQLSYRTFAEALDERWEDIEDIKILSIRRTLEQLVANELNPIAWFMTLFDGPFLYIRAKLTFEGHIVGRENLDIQTFTCNLFFSANIISVDVKKCHNENFSIKRLYIKGEELGLSSDIYPQEELK